MNYMLGLDHKFWKQVKPRDDMSQFFSKDLLGLPVVPVAAYLGVGVFMGYTFIHIVEVFGYTNIESNLSGKHTSSHRDGKQASACIQ